MNLAKATNMKMVKEVSANPENWERVLELLPEGSELILDDKGGIKGVVMQVVYMFDEGNKGDM